MLGGAYSSGGLGKEPIDEGGRSFRWRLGKAVVVDFNGRDAGGPATVTPSGRFPEFRFDRVV